MKFFKQVILFTIILTIFGLLGFYFLQSIIASYEVSVSPIGIGETQTSENIWYPKDNTANSSELFSNLTSVAAFFVDIDTGQIVYQRQPHLKLPIASLAKIMTSIIVLENKNWKDSYMVSEKAASTEPDHMILIPKEVLTVKDLMSGLFLVSANDAAEVFAEGTFGDRSKFISEMNNKAKQIGMKDSFFINPSGLEEDDKNQYSTAYDVALMSRYAITHFPELLNITSQAEIDIPENNSHQEYYLVSGINLVTTYPGVKGFKTGYTPEAGLTLVTYAEKNGHRILGVLLNSQDRRDEARELLDYSFSRLQ